MTTPVTQDSHGKKHLEPSTRMREKFLRELTASGLPEERAPWELVSELDLEVLPRTAQRYLRFMRVLGRPRDWSFCARWDGRFRMGPDKSWAACEAWQYNTSVDVARIFHMRMNLAGVVPTYVRDLYVHGGGHMAGKLLDTFKIADDQSEKVTIGELVTYLNDALIFAPSMLLGPATAWLAVDDGAFDITLTDRGTTVKARVFVDADGAMVDFSTTDRFGVDPANRKAGMVRTAWTTPIDGWVAVKSRMRPVGARAVWHPPSGDFCYVEVDMANTEITFDVTPRDAGATRG